MEKKTKPLFIVMSAPSGCGKSTLIDLLLQEYCDLQYSISCTTREPRGEEEDGIDYHFSVFDKHMLWSKEARKLRMTTNAWTVNKDEDIRRVIQHKVMYITTDNPVLVQKLIDEMCK